MIQVRNDSCPQNHKCPLVAICPSEAIRQAGFNAPVIDRERCMDCGLCAEKCPMRALEFTAV